MDKLTILSKILKKSIFQTTLNCHRMIVLTYYILMRLMLQSLPEDYRLLSGKNYQNPKA